MCEMGKWIRDRDLMSQEKCDHLMGVIGAYQSEPEEYIRASNPKHADLEDHERNKFCPDCGERLIND